LICLQPYLNIYSLQFCKDFSIFESFYYNIMKKNLLLLLPFILLFNVVSWACSPCNPLSNITQNFSLNGNNLEITFSSNAGWQCCYNVNIEIVCIDAAFTGVANYLSPQLCIQGGNCSSCTVAGSYDYPLTVIDVSGFCPGTYKWRAWEVPCYQYTQEYTFTITGASPMIVDASAADPVICEGESTQLTAQASNGCNGPYSYSWTPTTGLTGANTENPTATPTQTTTYTVNVTEPGSCAVTQTQQVTIQVDPLPTAEVTDNVAICEGDAGPSVYFIGDDGTGPYTITYTINGAPQPPVVTGPNDTVSVIAPGGTAGFYDYQLVSITDNGTTCTQLQDTYITVTVWPLPVVNAGQDIEICEANPVTPSDVTLAGSGAVSYTWDNGVINGESFVPSVGVTTYTVTGTDGNGCTDTDEVVVTAFPMPEAIFTASPDYGNAPISVNMPNVSQNASSYAWDFGNGNTENTNSNITVAETYDTPGTYTITLTASNGICWDTATYTIIALPPMIVRPPNVFTPNGDGTNDLYFVDVIYGERFEAEIFNRWGNQMATLNQLNQGWDGKTDGKDVEEGVYYILYKAYDYNDNMQEGHAYFHLQRDN
jgi:gliding motility-associated-like protein